MALSSALLRPWLSPLRQTHKPRLVINHRPTFTFRPRNNQLLHASTHPFNYPQDGGDDPANGTRIWSRTINSVYGGDPEYADEEGDSDEEEDRSLDLLVKFVHNVFRKISRRTRKAVRSVLPLSIPTELVGFSVNGVLILAFLWILKAFLEVVCTLGSAVFVSILLIRGIWTGITYAQEGRNHKVDERDDDPRIWNGTQPVT